MPLGAGKYDDACTTARNMTGGSVLLIVFGGNLGSGFSAQVTPDVLLAIPAVLRDVADQIEQEIEQGGS